LKQILSDKKSVNIVEISNMYVKLQLSDRY